MIGPCMSGCVAVFLNFSPSSGNLACTDSLKMLTLVASDRLLHDRQHRRLLPRQVDRLVDDVVANVADVLGRGHRRDAFRGVEHGDGAADLLGLVLVVAEFCLRCCNSSKDNRRWKFRLFRCWSRRFAHWHC